MEKSQDPSTKAREATAEAEALTKLTPQEKGDVFAQAMLDNLNSTAPPPAPVSR